MIVQGARLVKNLYLTNLTIIYHYVFYVIYVIFHIFHKRTFNLSLMPPFKAINQKT